MEWLLYRNGSEAVEDGGVFVDKRSGSVEGMGRFQRNGIFASEKQVVGKTKCRLFDSRGTPNSALMGR